MKILWSVLPLLVVLLSTSVAGQNDSTTPITGNTGATTLPEGQTDSATHTSASADATATQSAAEQTDHATVTQEITEVPSDSDSDSYSYVATSDLVRCYTCKDVLSNDECNGVDLGENGTLQVCSEDIPNCKVELKMNPAGTGWTFRKGCVDYNECYDNMYDSLLAEENAHCLGEIWSGRNDSLPLLGSTWCYFCCADTNKDKCNYDNYISSITFPEKNEWDPRMQWDFTIVEEDGDAAEHLKPMFLLTLAIFTVTSLVL